MGKTLHAERWVVLACLLAVAWGIGGCGGDCSARASDCTPEDSPGGGAAGRGATEATGGTGGLLQDQTGGSAQAGSSGAHTATEHSGAAGLADAGGAGAAALADAGEAGAAGTGSASCEELLYAFPLSPEDEVAFCGDPPVDAFAAVRALGDCRYEVTPPPGFEGVEQLGPGPQVIHVSVSDGTMGMLPWASGRNEEEACTGDSSMRLPLWFQAGDEAAGPLIIGICPCICGVVGNDPLLVNFGCSGPYVAI